MEEQFQHIALPRLYGAPAYARPAAPFAHTPRPLDLDDLPIAAYMTDEEIQLIARLPPSDGRVPATPGGGVAIAAPPSDGPIRPRNFSIRAFADRIRHPNA